MKNENPQKGQQETDKQLAHGTADIQENPDTNVPSQSKKKTNQSKNKKWTLRQHWQRASAAKRFKWAIEGIGFIVGLLVLASYIWGNLQTMWNFNAEHRPRLIFSRPPEVIGPINCEVTDKAIYLHTGAMRISVKNIKGSDAINAFVAGPEFKLVPEKKTGVAQIDELPAITGQMCEQKVSPKMKEFPVNGGQEVVIDLAQAMGAQSLVKTNSISVTLGGAQKEPETPPGENPEKISVAQDAVFQLYGPVCVYYLDERGERHATCQGYRLILNTNGTNLGSPTFSCTQSPLSGVFEQTLADFCEN